MTHPFYSFYHWIQNAPSLLEPGEIIESAANISFPNSMPSGDYQGNHRLGFIYQYLYQHVFFHSPSYTLLEEEIQINSQGRTLGAIDFIVGVDNRIEHWEVAIKFYLLYQGHWYGPNASDRLDKKLMHMINHQLPLSTTSPFLTQYGYSIDRHKLLMQGRLYRNPFDDEPIPSDCAKYVINPSAITGYWCFHHQWPQVTEKLYPLEKHQWASGDRPHSSSALRCLPDGFVHCRSELGDFWFIVPDHWPGEENLHENRVN
ncbi:MULTISPECIES: DUF1853 family protein [unclassified Vibrio]|uniref:DUF1853 family protein n=1 Tax=Vibrio sp. HB236076 TaxID=3232307 RepID=A0AB39HCZ3_9VIBR|nr:DUF1853 family protein [Vibrio sp. HB161653]MDP5253894.1 DUF1853 family protein [Vibrio sp. HB161653]